MNSSISYIHVCFQIRIHEYSHIQHVEIDEASLDQDMLYIRLTIAQANWSISYQKYTYFNYEFRHIACKISYNALGFGHGAYIFGCNIDEYRQST